MRKRRANSLWQARLGRLFPLEYRWTVLTVTTVGTLMAGLDSRIVIVGLPQVAAAMHADAEQAIWFTQAYALGTTVALLLIGRVTDIYGRVRVYTLGFVGFTLGSALTSLSQNSAELILFRGIQGFAVAALFANAAAIITDATPRNHLGFSLGINQTAYRFGAMAGLTVSGLILSFYDWRALFYINIPIGLFGTYWANRRLKEMAKVEKGVSIDWPGFGLFATAISTLLLSLTFAAYGEGSTAYVDGLFAACVASGGLFVLWETKAEHPLFDLSLLKIPEFAGGVVAQLMNGISWGALLLLLSLYFQLVKGYSPLQTGIFILPVDFAFLITGPATGRLSDRFGRTLFASTGLAIQGVSFYLFSTIDASTPAASLAAFMLLFGAGLGMFSTSNVSAVLESVPPERRGVASGFRSTFIQLGFAVSVNLAIVLMTLVAPYSVVSAVIASTSAAVSQADRLLFVKGLALAFAWMAVISFAAVVPSSLRSKRVRGAFS
ncbi:MAG: MFS transporter [Thaumarchaeota archaeon]|nr:MFS transporter [Nitrososphaerota archaeon]